ncbi:MAG: hypothetical protein ACM3YN_08385 [Parcubacteria group bacterium]
MAEYDYGTAFQTGWNAVQGFRDKQTRTAAGSAFASGDYNRASNVFAQGGMINEALGVQDYQTKRQDRATDVATAARTEKGKWLLQAAQSLTYIPAEKRQQEFQTHIAPVMKAMGIPDDAIAQIASSPMDDQSLHSFIAAFGGTPDMSAHKGDWKEIKNADGSSRFEFFPADPYQQQPQGGAPAPDAPVAEAQPPAQPQAPAQSGGDAYLTRLGQIESNNDPNARNGSSTGLYQFHPDTFARLGGTDINDPEQQKAAALKLAQESAQQLQAAGIQPDDANLYIMHQQGAGGGLALLKADPNANAIATLTPVYGNPARARQAIVNNGGSADMTAGQFVDMWRQKWGQGAQQPAQPYQVASAGETPPPPSQAPQAAPTGSGGMFSRPGSAAPAPKSRPATAQEKAAYGIPANIPAQMKADGTIDVISLPQGDLPSEAIGPGDPESGSILAQTGLSMPAFLAVTGQASKLPRDAATRNAAFRQAEEFANKRGVDLSTLSSQYDAYNKTLQANIMRNNQTNILEQELDGTISVLQPLAEQAGMGGLRVGNVARLFAGKEVNDPTVQQYRQQLLMLQSELAGMNAAARGNIDQSGNVKTDQSDMEDAGRVIVNGLNARGAGGLAQAIHSTTSKNRAVLENNIDTSRKAIWNLFGVGQHYKPLYGPRPHSTAGASKGLTPAQLKTVQRYKGSTAPGGSAQNPIVTRTKADYDRQPSGTHYIFTDGRVMVKP